MVREHSLIPTQKYVLLLLTSFNIFDKTAGISLNTCTSDPPTKKFVSIYYDMLHILRYVAGVAHISEIFDHRLVLLTGCSTSVVVNVTLTGVVQ